MNTEEMFQEVERRVTDSLLEHLIPKAINKHAKSKTHFHNCDCNYCHMKKEATRNIAHVVFPKDCERPIINNGIVTAIDPVTFDPIVIGGECEPWEVKDILRKNLREHYRNKLKELYDE